MYQAAKMRGVIIRFGCQVEIIDQSAPSVTLVNGETLKADLIVGADGKPERKGPGCVQTHPGLLMLQLRDMY